MPPLYSMIIDKLLSPYSVILFYIKPFDLIPELMMQTNMLILLYSLLE